MEEMNQKRVGNGKRPTPNRGRRPRLEWIGMAMILVAPLLGVAWSRFGVAGGVMQLIGYLKPRGLMWMLDVVPVLYLGAMISGAAIMMRERRRGFKEVVNAWYRLCLRCRYPLGDLDESGVCPECGTEFTSDGLEEGWRRTYARELR